MNGLRYHSKVISTLIAILVFNMVAPAFASVSGGHGKTLLCTQYGFEWVSTDQQQQKYLQLAQSLNLDIESLFPELNQENTDNYAGKCHFCFFEQQDLDAVASDLCVSSFQFVVANLVDKRAFVATLGKYLQPPNRAPPVSLN